MKFLSWNIERGHKIEEIIKVLLDLNPDIILLQEIDRGVGRTNHRDILNLLQKAFPDYYPYWSVEFNEIPSIWRRIIPIGGIGGGVHGNLILSRYPFLSKQTISLPVNEKLSWQGKTITPELFEPRAGSRIAQVCEVQTPKSNIFVANTHLENWRSSPKHRESQFEEILKFYKKNESNLWVIGGDMNTISGFIRFNLKKPVRETKSFRLFAQSYGLLDPFKDNDWTGKFSIWKGKVDWILTNKEQKIKKSSLGPYGLSDHRYLCLEMDI